MGELGASVGAVLVQESSDALEGEDVLVFPDAKIAWSDASFRVDGVGFGKDKGGAADGAAAEMDEVPVVGEAVDGGILAHRRDDDPVGEGYAAELNGGEEVIYWLGHTD